MPSSHNTNVAMQKIKAIGWPRLIGALLIAIIGGFSVLALAVSGVARTKNPQLALMLYPSESAALAARADQIFFSSPGKASAAAQRLAITAVSQQPINPKALRLLGLVAEQNRQPEKAGRLVTLSARLSRRDPGAQLWLIEHSARNGSTAETLQHYDTLLRTKPDTSAVLYPRLLNAIDDEDVRQNLLPYMQANRSWMASFLNFALANAKNLASLNDLIVENGGFPKTPFAQDQTKQLLARLIADKKFFEAQALYLSLPRATAERLRNASFDEFDANAQFGAIGWVINDTADAAFDIDPAASTKRPMLLLRVAPVTTTIVATKLLYLSPGNYGFAAKLAKLEMNKNAALRWQLRCATQNGAPAFWSVGAVAKSVSSALSVPTGCPVQMLEIIGSGGDGQAGLDAVISSIAIAA
jgi:hypothetical protein